MDIRIKRFKKCCDNKSENVFVTKDRSISILNDDCLIQIFLYLLICDRVRIQRVCKRWNEVSKLSWYLTRTLDCSSRKWGKSLNKDTHITMSILRQVLGLCGKFISKLDFSLIRGRDLIELHNVRFMGSKCFFTAVKKTCPNLTSIDISGLLATIEGIDYLTEHYDSITEFAIGNCKQKCDFELKFFFIKMKCLKSLRMHSTPINGECFKALNADVIEEITLENVYVASPDIFSNTFRKFHKLRAVVLQRNVILPQYQIKILNNVSNNANLKILKFNNYMDNINSNYNFVSNLNNLEILEFCGHTMLNDDLLIAIGTYCQKLIHAVFPGSNYVTNVGLNSLLCLPKLEHLEIRDARQINDQVFANMLNLKTLKCMSCSYLTNAGFKNLMQTSKKLEYLEVRYCTQVLKSLLISDAQSATRSRNNVFTICLDNNSNNRKTYKNDNLQIIEEMYCNYIDDMYIYELID